MIVDPKLSPEARRAEKRRMVEAGLERGIVFIRLSPRAAGVAVPAELAAEATAILRFSRRFEPQDLVVDEQGIAQTLTFKGTPARCFVAWDAVWSIEPEGDVGAMCGFDPTATPPEQVASFFEQLITQRIVLDRVSRCLNDAIGLHDTAAGSGAWRRWRAAVRELFAAPKPPPAAGPKLALVTGGKD